MRRRAALGGLLLLGGCGFRPLYMPEGGGRGSLAGDGLAAIYVPVYVNREGQLMRQALQRRFDGSGAGIAKQYDILAQPVIASEGIGILRDNSTTRFRMNGSVTWYLRKLDVAHTLLATGAARIVDGVNVNNQQYFALDLEMEAANKRVIEALADQVTQQLAIFLRKRAQDGSAGAPGGSAPASLAPAIPPENPGAVPDLVIPP